MVWKISRFFGRTVAADQHGPNPIKLASKNTLVVDLRDCSKWKVPIDNNTSDALVIAHVRHLDDSKAVLAGIRDRASDARTVIILHANALRGRSDGAALEVSTLSCEQAAVDILGELRSDTTKLADIVGAAHFVVVLGPDAAIYRPAKGESLHLVYRPKGAYASRVRLHDVIGYVSIVTASVAATSDCEETDPAKLARSILEGVQLGVARSYRYCENGFGDVAITVVFALSLLAAGNVLAGTTHRPIMDFVDAQGQVSFGPPGTEQVAGVADFVGFTDTKQDRAISADYAGLADEALGGILGTTCDGDITVRPVAEHDVNDHRVLVHVVLHTDNELMWVIPFDFDPNNKTNQFGLNPLLFGARPADILAGAKPALGSSTLTLDFIMPQGGPLPDLEELAFGNDPGLVLLSVRFVATADGFFADGSAGKVQVTQVGVFNNGFHGAVGDGFPAESIILIDD
jgi:hypothetical protein